MILMNKDREVLFFDDEDKTITILNNAMLPYQLLDDLKDSEEIQTIGEGIRNYDKLRSFFADRVLSLSRDNAKQILESIQYTQKLTEEQSFQLSLKCRGVHVNDSYWVKRDDEANYPHVRYEAVTVDGVFCCKCKCFSDDSTSFIDAEYVKRYCDNHGMDFLEFVKDNYASEFADMAVIDYCLGNLDRH